MSSVKVTVTNSGNEDISVSLNGGTATTIPPSTCTPSPNCNKGDFTLDTIGDYITITGNATVTSSQIGKKYLTKSSSTITYTLTQAPSFENENESITVQDDDPGEEN